MAKRVAKTSPIPRPSGLDPGRRRRDWLKQYEANRELDIREADQRSTVGLRQRRDGTPSARPPQATLPVKHWATIKNPPDAYEEDGVANLLADYRERLRRWKQLGLYDGPTELTIVNRSSGRDEPTGDAT